MTLTTQNSGAVSRGSRQYAMPKNDPGPPRNNGLQNTQAADARKAIERQLGRPLSPQEIKQFHDLVSGQGYGYHEIVEEGLWKFDKGKR